MPFSDVRGVRIHYQVLGERGPWLTLTTGGRRGHDEFVPLASRIAQEGFRVLLHDRRNTGVSDILIDDGPAHEGEEEIWADDLDELLGQLDARPAFIGGASAGSRMSILLYLRHPDAVRGLLLMRLTGGEFAAGRLPENYYGQFIRAAQKGGMEAVCATEQYRERVAANPKNGERLMRMDAQRYIEVMSRWLDLFRGGPHSPVMGLTEAQLSSIRVPALIIPGNDKVHASTSGRAAHRLIPGSEFHQLPIEDQDVPLIAYPDWAPYEEEIARTFVDFMRRVAG